MKSIISGIVFILGLMILAPLVVDALVASVPKFVETNPILTAWYDPKGSYYLCNKAGHILYLPSGQVFRTSMKGISYCKEALPYATTTLAR